MGCFIYLAIGNQKNRPFAIKTRLIDKFSESWVDYIPKSYTYLRVEFGKGIPTACVWRESVSGISIVTLLCSVFSLCRHTHPILEMAAFVRNDWTLAVNVIFFWLEFEKNFRNLALIINRLVEILAHEFNIPKDNSIYLIYLFFKIYQLHL